MNKLLKLFKSIFYYEYYIGDIVRLNRSKIQAVVIKRNRFPRLHYRIRFFDDNRDSGFPWYHSELSLVRSNKPIKLKDFLAD